MTRYAEELYDLIVEVLTSDCLACGGEADGELICVACDIAEDQKARRREDW